jgi:hypothetical protein
MEYSSQIRIESKKCAGVAFTLRKMMWKRRQALRDKQREAREKLRQVQEQRAPLSKEYVTATKAAEALVKLEREKLIAAGATAEAAAKQVPLGAIDFDESKLDKLMELAGEATRIDQEELTPVAVAFVLVGIEGLTYTDPDLGDTPVPATLDLLIQRGPDELYYEIAHAVAGELGLLPNEVSNLESPSTSAAAVDGSETPGSAAFAGKLVTTINEVVRSSTAPANAGVSITP